VSEPLLVRAARRDLVERTPVWFMRQAGRSLPEYRAVRGRHSLFEICSQPELCAEVTLQPVRAHGVDAAVIYSDIMLPVAAMGVGIELVEGLGPVVDEPIRSRGDLARLRRLDPEGDAASVLEAIALVRSSLPPEKAVVGFVGGPFTVAGYLIEGRPSRTFTRTKQCMYGTPEVWHGLMEHLADAFSAYAVAQAGAGADVIQLFDSWAGVLSVADYREFVAPYSARILAALRVPSIHFATGSSHLLEDLRRAGGDVIGLDWRVPLDRGWELVGWDRGVQGNLDPALLLGPFERVAAETAAILDRAADRPGHIFNLGHGVLPETDPVALRRLRELVHELSEQRAAA
jgi:uroporphyrinogen decarboxylase